MCITSSRAIWAEKYLPNISSGFGILVNASKSFKLFIPACVWIKNSNQLVNLLLLFLQESAIAIATSHNYRLSTSQHRKFPTNTILFSTFIQLFSHKSHVDNYKIWTLLVYHCLASQCKLKHEWRLFQTIAYRGSFFINASNHVYNHTRLHNCTPIPIIVQAVALRKCTLTQSWPG